MDIKQHEKLTHGQTVGFLIGLTLGPEFLKLPNLLVTTAKQDSWISAIIALIYPISIIITVNIIVRKYPEDNLMQINKKVFGKLLGSILSVMFLLQFVIYTGSIISEYARIARVFIVAFLSPLKISIVCFLAALYIASLGLKTLAKVSEVITYFIAMVILLTVFIFKEGNLVNLMPVFEVSIGSILSSSVKTSYFFGGLEAILMIHPHVRDIKGLKKSSLTALLFCSVVWVWSVFSTIYYLGIDMIPKSLWSFFLIYDSVNFPIINNVRYVFMFVWTLVSLRIIANYIFLNKEMIREIVYIKTKTILLALSVIILGIAYVFANDLLRQEVLRIMSPSYVIFNMLLLFSLAGVSLFKGKGKGKSK
jgi:spore germination protein